MTLRLERIHAFNSTAWQRHCENLEAANADLQSQITAIAAAQAAATAAATAATAILIRHEPGIYEAHSQFLPEGRNRTRDAMRAVFDYMFTRTDCERIITQIPDNNRAAQGLARIGRFQEMFRLENTPRGPTAYVGLTIEQWIQDTPSLETDSEWFHAPITEAVKKARPDFPDHPEDRSHERAVGAAVRMIRRGNVAKGVTFYNRWARFAGFTCIRTLSTIPPVFDVSEPGLSCVVGVRDDELEILLCQSA
jgi:hypothetical protein